MKSYFHDDLGFVSVVLDPTDRPADLLQSIANHFNERWLRLLTVTGDELSAAASAFEYYLSRREAKFSEPQQIPGLLTDDFRSTIGQEMLLQLTDELDTAALDGEIFAQVQHSLSQQRDLLCVGSTPARGLKSNGIWIQATCGARGTNGSSIWFLKQRSEPSMEKAQIEYYISPAYLSQFIVVAQEHNAIAYKATHGDEELVDARIDDLLLSHQVLVDTINKLEEAINRILNETEEAKNLFNLLESKALASATFEYKKWALYGMLNNFSEEWPSRPNVKILEEEGFWKFFKSTRVLKALAKMSAALAADQSLNVHSDDVLDGLVVEETDLAFRTLAKLREQFDLHLSGRIGENLQLRI